MITARAKNKAYLDGREVQVSGLVNRGGCFGKTWLIGISSGYQRLFLVIEADCFSDAVDELADSPTWGHEINIPDEDMSDYDPETVQRAGNDGHPVDLDHLDFVCECEVNYFASPNHFFGVPPS